RAPAEISTPSAPLPWAMAPVGSTPMLLFDTASFAVPNPVIATPGPALPEMVFAAAPPITAPVAPLASHTPTQLAPAAAPLADRPITLPRTLVPLAPIP